MIANATPTLPRFRPAVPQTGRGLMYLSDVLRDEAALELGAALDGVSVKRIRSANVPGAGVTFLSRSQNGDSANPLFRLASIFVLGRMLGVPKSRFQRLLDWLQERLDEAYADRPAPSVEEALEQDSALDPQDDHLRFRAAKGCPEARRELIEVKRRQRAFDATVIYALQQG